MQSLQPQSGGGAGKSWDDILSELSADIAHKVPGKYDIEVALLDFPVLYEECMNTVLVQELIRFNRVLGTVASSLKEVQRAVKGLVVMRIPMADRHEQIHWIKRGVAMLTMLGD